MAKAKKKKASSKPKAKTRAVTRKPAMSTPKRISGKRMSWLDEAAQTPQIDGYARRLGSFMDALADGVVQDSELKAQEKRLVKLMKEIEPRLDDGLHERITELLCELTAYDIMQLLHAMQSGRTSRAFRG